MRECARAKKYAFPTVFVSVGSLPQACGSTGHYSQCAFRKVEGLREGGNERDLTVSVYEPEPGGEHERDYAEHAATDNHPAADVEMWFLLHLSVNSSDAPEPVKVEL
jgi:hypothetical protein